MWQLAFSFHGGSGRLIDRWIDGGGLGGRKHSMLFHFRSLFVYSFRFISFYLFL